MSALASDFNDMVRQSGAAAIQEAIEAAEAPDAFAPEPLRRPLPHGAEFPLDALGPVLGPAAAAIHEVVKSPAAICGQSVLAAASLAAQPHGKVLIDGRCCPLSLWVLSIAESGDRKSACDGPALRAHREHEKQLMALHQRDMEEYRLKFAAWKQAHDQVSKGARKSAAELSDALASCGPPPDEPLKPLLLASDPTIEGLHKLLHAGRGSVGVFTDEGGLFVGGHGMSAENATKTAAGFSSLWDRGEADRIRGGDGVMKLYGKAVALHLMLQPVIAEQVLCNRLLAGQGFLARCLVAWPQSTAGTRTYASIDLTQDARMGRYWQRMTTLLENPYPIRDATRNELDPPLLRLANDAKALWIKAHDEIEKRQLPGQEYADIKPWASKAPEQILRIAGVLSMVNDPDSRTITEGDIASASRLVDFYLSEALRLHGVAGTDPDVRAAEALLEWCWDRGCRIVHSGQLLRMGPTSVRDAKALGRATALLESTGWFHRVDGGMKLDGAKRSRVWSIQPKGGC